MKSAIQNRIAQQRNSLNARKKTASRESKQRMPRPPKSYKSTPSVMTPVSEYPISKGQTISEYEEYEEYAEDTMGFEDMGIEDSGGSLHSSVFSSAPSELHDLSNREGDCYDDFQSKPPDVFSSFASNRQASECTATFADVYNVGNASLAENLVSTAPSELADARNREDTAPTPTTLAPWHPLNQSTQQPQQNKYISPMDRRNSSRRISQEQPLPEPALWASSQPTTTQPVGTTQHRPQIEPDRQERRMSQGTQFTQNSTRLLCAVQESSTSQPPTLEDITKSVTSKSVCSNQSGQSNSSSNKFAFF